MAVQTSSLIGVNFSDASSDAAYGLGTRVGGTDGSQFVYALAAEAATQYSFGAIGVGNTFLNSTDAVIKAGVGKLLGIAQATLTSSQHGWFQTNGIGRVRTNAIALPNVGLYTCDTETGATSGCLDNSTNSASSVQIFGIMLTATGSTTGSSAACVINNMVAVWPKPLA